MIRRCIRNAPVWICFTQGCVYARGEIRHIPSDTLVIPICSKSPRPLKDPILLVLSFTFPLPEEGQLPRPFLVLLSFLFLSFFPFLFFSSSSPLPFLTQVSSFIIFITKHYKTMCSHREPPKTDVQQKSGRRRHRVWRQLIYSWGYPVKGVEYIHLSLCMYFCTAGGIEESRLWRGWLSHVICCAFTF